MQSAVLIFGILVGGFVFGSAARLIIPGSERLTLAETTLVGIAGSGVGAVLTNLFTPGTAPTGFGWWTVLGVLVGSVLVLLIVTLVMKEFGWRQAPPVAPTAAQLIAGGEGHQIEFKQTARWNHHTADRDPRLELVIAKTVAGFLNAEGGTLLVGVHDDGTATGLAEDLALMKSPDHDRYELWLTDHLERCLGKPAVAHIRVGFEPVAGTAICRIEITPSPDPVFLDEPGGSREADVYVRMGNSTRKLLTDEALDYIKHHWA